jgi:hypothetical protein
MCGPFVAVYSGFGSSGRARALVHLAYHLGRLLTYATLGALAGLIGRAVDLAGSAAGVARISALIAGALMMIWGLGAMLATQGVKVLPLGAPRAVKQWLAGALSRLNGRPPVVRALVVGLVTTLLPCGWLYAFAVTAAGTGHILSAMGVMAAFWLGSVPLLLGAGVGFAALSSRVRKHGPLFSSALLMAVGVATIVLRVNVPAFAIETVRASVGPLPKAQPVNCPFHRE